jgi:hypothetical protein
MLVSISAVTFNKLTKDVPAMSKNHYVLKYNLLKRKDCLVIEVMMAIGSKKLHQQAKDNVFIALR